MPAKNALRDVNPLALTLCKQGANRQRIFLRKTAGVAEKDLLTLPAGRMPILKTGADWTTFYCVVAAPGAEEDPGMVGDQDSVDVWADEAEIRKAAHRLLKNAAFVNTEHDGPAAEGCAIVESAVALADLTVGDTVIAEGSWYVGIEPSAELRKSIEDGTIEAISLEGSGVREPLEKSHVGEDTTGPIRHLIAHYMSKPHPFTACVRDNSDRFGPERAKRICATLKDMGTGTHNWRGGDIKKSTDDMVDEWTAALVAAGVTTQNVPLLKAYFAEQAAIAAEYEEALGGELSTLRPTDERRSDEEDQMGLAEDFAALKKDTDDKLGEIKKTGDATTAAVEGLVGLVGKLVDRVEKIPESKDDKKDEPADLKKVVTDLGTLADKVDEFDKGLESIAKSVRALGEGDTSQGGDGDIRKQNNKDPLAGLLA